MDPESESETLRRHELGRYLRLRRDRLQPEQAGLAPRGRRRVAGLRRYEVADLAAVSETWYTWLEQGRPIHIRPESLDAVARALQLDEDERRYVRLLAGIPVVDPEVPAVDVLPELVALVDDLDPHPASLSTTALDILAVNRTLKALHFDPSDFPPRYRNALWIAFTASLNSHVHDREAGNLSVLARFRFQRALFPANPRFDEVIEELREVNAEFSELWDRGGVQPTTGHSVAIDHPELGELRFAKLNLSPPDREDLLLTVHRPADAVTRQRMQELAAMLDELVEEAAGDSGDG